MPDYPPVRRNIPSPPGPPAGKITKKPGAPKAKGAVRAKSGCYTCRIRRKKCDEQPNSQGSCQTCVRLRLQCLGFGAKRPEWMREPESVPILREKIKTFLASQGMIKGHSGPGPRNSDQQPQILMLSDRSNPRARPPRRSLRHHLARGTGPPLPLTCGMPSTLTSPSNNPLTTLPPCIRPTSRKCIIPTSTTSRHTTRSTTRNTRPPLFRLEGLLFRTT